MRDVFRRKHLPDELDSIHRRFMEAVSEIEEAKRALVESVPTARAPGRPLADALNAYEDGLARAAAAMPAWRAQAVEAAWSSCREALVRAMEMADAFRLGGQDLPFDELMFTLQDLMAPLDEFREAADRFRALRR